MRTIQAAIAVLLFLLAITGFAVVAVLVKAVPMMVSLWEQEGRALSVVERLLVHASFFCQSYWFLLLLVLLGVVGFSGALLIRALIRRNSAPLGIGLEGTG